MMDKIRTYKQALEFMYAHLPMYQRLGPIAYKKDLSNTIRLCEKLGNPQNKIKTIHIAGTNGKGTTSHIIAAGLQAQGYKVGIYTSPHFKDFRERIKINGVYISRQYIVGFLNTIYDDIKKIQPSFFEMTVALAFDYFANQQLDFAVIETGLGGRLDSTNIITPLLSVITNISYDHQNLLGNTLQEIAGEKAGIIKSCIPVVIGETQDEVKHVFIDKAKSLHTNISFADAHIKITPQLEKQDYLKKYDIYLNDQKWISDFKTDLVGPFQEKNLITGLYALHILSAHITISKDKIVDFFPSLKPSTKYIGRWQKLGDNPYVMTDSAHNEGGLRLVINEVANLQKRKVHFVLGFVNDKDLSMVLELFPKTGDYYFAKANIPRGLDATELKNLAAKSGLLGKSYSSVRKALAAAKIKAQTDDMIYIGGSIFVVSEVI